MPVFVRPPASKVNFRFKKNVWAVGQGGFSSGVLKTRSGSHVYSYVYDCGSNHTDKLERELLEFYEQCKKINTVYLSHLDYDHVSGFDLLCGLFSDRIDEVVLPYLDQISRVFLYFQASSSGVVSGSYLAFLEDPVAWITQRLPGADIVFVGNPSDGDGDGDDGVGPFTPDGEPGLRLSSRDKEHGLLQFRGRSNSTEYTSLEQYSWISRKVSAASNAARASIELVTFATPHDKKRMAAFLAAIQSSQLPNLDFENIKEILRDESAKEALRDCYDALATDHNIVSMHLLVRSLVPVVSRAESHNSVDRLTGKFAFLFSGDAKLSSAKHYNAWFKAYRAVLDQVTIFSLPHHGSALSFSVKLIDAMPRAWFIAQAGKNSHGHPARSVFDRLRRRFRAYSKVGSKTRERVILDCIL